MSDEAIAKRARDLEINVNISIRYHSKLQGHYDGLTRWISTIGLLFGSATFASIVTNEDKTKMTFAIWASAIVTFASFLERGFSFGEKSRTHRDLFRRFVSLAAQMKKFAPLDLKNLNKFESERLTIEIDELPVKSTLARICHKEETHVRGIANDHVKVSRLGHLTACFISPDIGQYLDISRLFKRRPQKSTPLSPPPTALEEQMVDPRPNEVEGRLDSGNQTSTVT